MKTIFFTEQQESNIIDSIKKAEKSTSGEIRVHIERGNNADTLERAKLVFHLLEMDKTKYRNGVIFYLDIENKKFAVYGDEGINKKVPSDFWDKIKDEVISNFKRGDYENGIINGITMSGEALKKYFPYQKDDINELSDDISKERFKT